MRALHGPHQGAQKSTKTVLSPEETTLSKLYLFKFTSSLISMPVKVVKVWVSVVQDLRRRRTRRVTAPAKVRKSMTMKPLLGFFLAGAPGGPAAAPGAPGGPPGGGGPPTGGAPGGGRGLPPGPGMAVAAPGAPPGGGKPGPALGASREGFVPAGIAGKGAGPGAEGLAGA